MKYFYPAGTSALLGGGGPTDLDALEALDDIGFPTRLDEGVWRQRSMDGTENEIIVVNPFGVDGNPTFSLGEATSNFTDMHIDAEDNEGYVYRNTDGTYSLAAGTGGGGGPDLTAIEALTGTGIAVRSGADTWVLRYIQAGDDENIIVDNGDGVSGNPVISLNYELISMSKITFQANTPGLLTTTDEGGYLRLSAFNTATSFYETFITLGSGDPPYCELDERVVIGDEQYIYRGDGVDVAIVDGGTGASDAPTARSNLGAQTQDADLDALAALSSTGIAVRSASNTWVQRQVVGTTNQVIVVNPAGIAGDITLSLPQDIATTSNPMFKHILQTTSFTGSPNISQLSNTAATGQSDAVFSTTVSSTDGDAFFRCGVGIVGFYAFGVDGSDSNKFKMVYDANSQVSPSTGGDTIFTCSGGSFVFSVPVTFSAGFTDNAGILSRTVDPTTNGVGSPYAITTGDENKVFTNEGATAKVYFNLPATAVGKTYTFYCDDADGLRVKAPAGSTIRSGSSVSASGGYAESTTPGSLLSLVAVSLTKWVDCSMRGTWSIV